MSKIDWLDLGLFHHHNKIIYKHLAMNLTNLSDIRSILKTHRIKAKKGFGQNFLLDTDALDASVEAAQVSNTDIVVEIGPGMGVLTQKIAEHAKQVVCLEVDEDMIEIMQDTLSDYDNVTVNHQDALTFDPPFPQYKIVANIPYNITGILIRHFLEEVTNRPTSITLLVQKEVAKKACLTVPNNNLLALGIQMYGSAQYIMDVPSTSFFPVPKVDSAILHIDCSPEAQIENPQKCFTLIRHCFRQKRKKLRNTLKSMYGKDGLKILETQFDCTRRPQELTLSEWSILLNLCNKQS
jgi:16S rRNA (adenine1518-N6/adenine1519-N6)-dimethyltransferase